MRRRKIFAPCGGSKPCASPGAQEEGKKGRNQNRLRKKKATAEDVHCEHKPLNKKKQKEKKSHRARPRHPPRLKEGKGKNKKKKSLSLNF